MLDMGVNPPNEVEIENAVNEVLCELSEARTEANSTRNEI
jgi:hypothetical protein